MSNANFTGYLKDILAAIVGLAGTPPTGAATSAKQDTGNTALQAIETAVEGAQPAGENHIGEVGSPIDVITVSLTVAVNAHTAGDVLAATQEIANCVRVNDGRALLQSVVAIDTDDQGVALDLVFFSADTSLGAEESAPDIDDTEVLTVLGTVEIAASDYDDFGVNRVATVKQIGLGLEAAAGTRSVYVAAITQGTPTYASGVVTLRLTVLQG